MKITKRQIAFPTALMALIGAANAQSNVTLFGVLDLNLTHYRAGQQTGGINQTVLNDGTVNGLNGSRWGIRGQEDLGGDLKAGFWLESGFNADTGQSGQGGRLFGRQAYISLSSASAGELRAGRQTILSDVILGRGAPFGSNTVTNSGIGVTNMGKNLPMWIDAPRADNALQYQTPNMGGANAAVQYAPGEGVNDIFYGLRLQYDKAPFYIGASYEWNKDRTTGDMTNKISSLSANYDFGAFRIMGGIQHNNKLTTTSGNGAAVGVSNLVVTGSNTFTLNQTRVYTVGAEIPVGTSTVVGVNYTGVKYESATSANANLGRIAVSARYGLSKNTFLYSGAWLATGNLKDYISQKTLLQAGLRTAF